MLAVGADASERIHRLLWLRSVKALLDEFGITQNGGERSSELVAHIGHELVLVLARDLKIFDSFGKLTGSGLHLLKKPRVFNRDHGLVRKGIDELDLAFGERAHFAAPNEDHPNCLACVNQKNYEHRAKSGS